MESAAYFLVAECLTNATRHAGARRAGVTIVDGGDRLDVDVEDDGVGGADPTAAPACAGWPTGWAPSTAGSRSTARSRAGPGSTPRSPSRDEAHAAADPRVVVADDSVVIRQGVVRILGEAGMAVVGEARSADELSPWSMRDPPDVAVVDIRMPPGGNAGLLAALDIRARHGDRTRVLVLSQYLEPEYALRLLGAGAGGVGYLLKDRLSEPHELADAVRRVAAGGSAIDPSVVDELVRARRGHDRVSRLTEREREILGSSPKADPIGPSPSAWTWRPRRSKGRSGSSSPSSRWRRTAVTTVACWLSWHTSTDEPPDLG